MTDPRPSSPSPETHEHCSVPKRAWAKPVLETFGTIADLTRGPQGGGKFDSAHPPGQNKSTF